VTYDPNQDPTRGMAQPPYEPGAQPGYPPQYQQPVGYPPAPRKKSRTPLVLGIVGAVVVLCCGAGVLTVALGGKLGKSGTSGTSGGGHAAATNAAAPKNAGLDQPVRDGRFEFTVTKVACGKTKEGDEFLNKAAQGQFCEVSMTVRNIGNQPQTFSGSWQKVKGATGASYSDDTEAEIYANTNNQTIFNKINPGNSVQGLVVFDVPKDARLTSLELHDSPFSGGVTVTVG
jgi:hypothetical protein